jgi:hypothetical protein
MYDPISPEFKFSEFFAKVKDLPHRDMVFLANCEVDHVERVSVGVKGAVENRKLGSLRYKAEIDRFMSLVCGGMNQAGASQSDLARYKPVISRLVKDGTLKPGTFVSLYNETP